MPFDTIEYDTPDGLPPRLPRIDDLLKGNDSPLDSELDFIRREVSLREARLAAIEKDVAVARTALSHKIMAAELARQDLEEHQAVSSPMRRLSAEILSEIFLRCLEDDVGWSFPSGDSDTWRKTIWVLIKVCRRWRLAAINDTRLWSSMKISLDRPRPHSRNGIRHAFDSPNNAFLQGAQLQRSGSHTLTILLNARGSVAKDNRLLQPLLSTSARWGNIAIAMHHSSFTLLSPIRGFLQSLHTLGLAPGVSVPDGNKNIDVFEFAPNLRTLRVSSCPDIASVFSLPLSQITSFEWNAVPATLATSSHMQMLRRLPNLVECSLDCRTDDSTDTTVLPLPKLRRLVLKEQRFGCVARIMQSISAPALEELNLILDKLSSPRDIVHLLDRSQCRLTSLSLQTAYFPGEDMRELFSAVPLLERLAIFGHPNFSKIIIDELIPRSETLPQLLPRLSFLHLPAIAAENHSKFVRLMEVRRQAHADGSGDTGLAPGVASFVRLSLGEPIEFVDLGLKAQFQQLCADGLRVSVGETNSLLVQAGLDH